MKNPLDNFKGIIGKTAAGHHYIIKKIGSRGLRTTFLEVATEKDKEEVDLLIAKLFDVGVISYTTYGATKKEREENLLNDYNKFLKELKE